MLFGNFSERSFVPSFNLKESELDRGAWALPSRVRSLLIPQFSGGLNRSWR